MVFLRKGYGVAESRLVILEGNGRTISMNPPADKRTLLISVIYMYYDLRIVDLRWHSICKTSNL
jgi:hypothetical protein